MSSVKEKILEALAKPWEQEYRYSSTKGNKIEKHLATSGKWKQEKGGRAIYSIQDGERRQLRITLLFAEIIIEELVNGHGRWGTVFKAPIKSLKVDSKGFSYLSTRFNYP